MQTPYFDSTSKDYTHQTQELPLQSDKRWRFSGHRGKRKRPKRKKNRKLKVDTKLFAMCTLQSEDYDLPSHELQNITTMPIAAAHKR